MPATAVVAVSSASELKLALANAKGGETILLAAGDYGALSLNGATQSFAKFASEVTIQSADPDNPAVLTGLSLQNVQNLTFESITFDYSAAPGAPDFEQLVSINGSTNIAIKDSVFDGDIAEGVSAAVNGYPTGQGLWVGNSVGITIEGNEFSNFTRGAVFSGVDKLTVSHNEVYDVRSDGLDFADVDNVLVEGNYIHDFKIAADSGDHGDMIQFWTTGTTNPSVNITIRGNVLDSGAGLWSQSIFMSTDASYQNVLIENNVIYNAQSHGISVGKTLGLTISNNTILQNADSAPDGSLVYVPTINVTADSQDVIVSDNIVPRLNLTSTSELTVQNNLVVQRNNPDGPNYVGDLFVNGLSDLKATAWDLTAVKGGLIEQKGVGADLTHFDTTPDKLAGYLASDSGTGLELLTQSLTIGGVFGPAGQIDLAGATITWNFGDGTSGAGNAVTHTFKQSGEYDVSATVTLANGQQVVLNKTIAASSPLAIDVGFDGSVTDLSDLSNKVVVGAGVTFEKGIDGQAIRLNGSNVAYTATSDLLNNKEYTLIADFKKDVGGETSGGRLINFSNSFVVDIQSNGFQVAILTDKGTQWLYASNIGINDADWHRLGLTFSSETGSVILYVDGQEVGRLQGLQGAIQVGSSVQEFVVGNPSGAGFTGLIDNVQFWRGAMTAQQITLAEAETPPTSGGQTNTAAVIGGTATGAITEDAAATLTTSGKLTVTDPDAGQAGFTQGTIAGTYGSLTIDATGAWTYSAANNQAAIQSLNAGQKLTDTIQVKTIDGTTKAIAITITGVNDVGAGQPTNTAATIGGTAAGAITEDAAATLTTSGKLTVTDPDAGQAGFTAGTIAGAYGSLTIDATGAWTYSASNTQSAIQSLNAGQKLTDTIQVKTIDGTTKAIAITITGVNDVGAGQTTNTAATIGGTAVGAVTEDTAATLTTSGKLTVTDPDAGQAGFTQGTIAGAYGSLTIDATGAWTYSAANTQSAIQSLAAGQKLTDTIQVKTIDGTTKAIAITITGVNDAAVIGGTATGAITEDAAATLTTSGKLTVTDPDAGQAGFTQGTIAGAYGSLTIDATGAWTYSAANTQSAIQSLAASQKLTDTIQVKTIDGTTKAIAITITGVNDAAVIGGTATGAITEDAAATLTTSGKLTVTDPDAGQAGFTKGTIAGTYGSLTIDANGAWTYSASNTQSAIQSLAAGQKITDTIQVKTIDGTTKNVQIDIAGINDGASAPTNPTISLENTVTNLAENTKVGFRGIKVADIVVNGDGVDTDTLKLTGADAASFRIRFGDELYFVGASPNYEVKSNYVVGVTTTDAAASGLSALAVYGLRISDVNEESQSSGSPGPSRPRGDTSTLASLSDGADTSTVLGPSLHASLTKDAGQLSNVETSDDKSAVSSGPTLSDVISRHYESLFQHENTNASHQPDRNEALNLDQPFVDHTPGTNANDEDLQGPGSDMSGSQSLTEIITRHYSEFANDHLALTNPHEPVSAEHQSIQQVTQYDSNGMSPMEWDKDGGYDAMRHFSTPALFGGAESPTAEPRANSELPALREIIDLTPDLLLNFNSPPKLVLTPTTSEPGSTIETSGFNHTSPAIHEPAGIISANDFVQQLANDIINHHSS